MVEIAPPYLLFIGDVHDALAAKTAQRIVDWRPERCIGQFKLPNCKADLGIPFMSIGEAARQGARTMVIGVASAGGAIPSHWVPHIVEAIDAGMDVACGMHDRLSSIPEIAEAASARGRQLHDVRHSTIRFQTGKGAKRSGKRLLTVGTDCSVGRSTRSSHLKRNCRRGASTRISEPPGRPESSSPDAASRSTRW